MQLDTALVKVPGVDIGPGDHVAIIGLVMMLALMGIIWYVIIKKEEP